MSNEASVQSALKLLAEGLDPYIEGVLSPHLDGELQWTDVLGQLDAMKGKSPRTYSRSDVQCQLRVITERLGGLGYPFDSGDPLRTLSTYGNELRIVRNRWAHGSAFTTLEAMRAVDTVFIVLNHVGDAAGAGKAAQERGALVAALVDESKPEGSDDQNQGGQEELGNEGESSSSEGDESVLEVDEDPKEQFTSYRTVFEAWDVVVTGSVETLDSLPKKTAKEAVRSSIEEIVDSEGPIHRDRLTKLVGYTFGLAKVHEARAKKILNQIKASDCIVDGFNFVWPGDVDPSQWKIYRQSPVGSPRKFLEISPVEIVNAASHILRTSGPQLDSDLRRKTLLLFGRKRNTQAFATHFEKSVQEGLQAGRMEVDPTTGMYQLV